MRKYLTIANRFVAPKQMRRLLLVICVLSGISPQTFALDLSPDHLKALQQLSPGELQQLVTAANKKQTTVIDTADSTTTQNVEPRRTQASTKKAPPSPGLKPFGYDLFAGQPSTFAPATYIPIPTDYVIGPGDTIKVQLFGSKNAEYQLTVSREGTIAFPELGPFSVAGMKFDDMQQIIDQRVGEQFIGVKSAINLGNLRSIHVFVLGDVNYPGAYTISALATMTNALFVSGGINPIGSLRNIQLKRKGKIVTTLDLYDLLLKGDTRADGRLQPGDVIFIPPAKQMVSITGPVRRSASYEIKNEKSIGQLIDLAGGLSPFAYPKEVRLERITDNHQRQLLDVDLSTAKGRQTPIKGGDFVRIFSVLEKVDNIVLLSGHVFRPITSQWYQGMRLTDLIPSTDELKPNADLEYTLIVRSTPPRYNISTISANLSAALAQPESDANITLQPKDQIVVFNTDEDRQQTLQPFLKKVMRQANYGNPAMVVNISGEVRFPGDYPLDQNMRVNDLIRAAGGLKESTYTAQADLTRLSITEQLTRETQHTSIDLNAILAGDPSKNTRLRAHDRLNIKSIPKWAATGSVFIKGEVRFPGDYPIKEGETLRDVIKRAGGLNDKAFVEATVFLREDLRRREQQQLDVMTKNLESDLATLALEKGEISPEQRQAHSFAKNLVNQLRSTEAIGRLVVNMQDVLKDGQQDIDIPLRNGDKVYIPAIMHEVTVLGEVFSPTSHLHNKKLGRKDYINLSGGLTSKADDDKVYIVRASGTVIPSSEKSAKKVYPGDTIVIPMDVDRISKLKLWTDVTQVLYQLSLTAASLKTVGLF